MAETGNGSLGNEDLGLGATGEFPKGQISEDDQGELKVALGINKEHKRIMIDFGKSISWLGLAAEEARAFAYGLLAHADKLDQLK
jgi:hypothetical protein